MPENKLMPTLDSVAKRIVELRGQRVMLDADLAVLDLVYKILDIHAYAFLKLSQNARLPQVHIMEQANRHVSRCQKGINTALAELKEANYFARMITF